MILFVGDKAWFPTAAYFLGVVVVAVGGCIAYHHLHTTQGTQRAAVLTSLDAAWMGSQLEKSRTAYLKFKNEFQKIEGIPDRETFIKDRMQIFKVDEHQYYRELMGMVNFFETLGYFSKVGYILYEDAIELYGPAIRENDATFRDHILKLQEEAQDKSIFSNFIWLADKLEPQSD